MFKFLKKYIKVPYKDVGNCPRCGSNLTGLYFKSNNDNSYTMFSHLKYSAELSLPKQDLSDGLNCFCINCNISWNGKYTTRWLSLEELASLKNDKNISTETTARFKNYKKEQKQEYKNYKKQIKKEKNQQKRKEIISWLKK